MRGGTWQARGQVVQILSFAERLGWSVFLDKAMSGLCDCAAVSWGRDI